MKVRRIIGIALAGMALAALASQIVFFARYPYFRRYARQNGIGMLEARKALGRPNADSEFAMGLAVEASLENWDAVARLAAKDHRTEIGTYYYNLSNAVQGKLADRLMHYYQPFERGLFLPVGEHSSPFQIGCSSDVWFAIGYMPLAERNAMLGLLFSPAHTGSRYLRRLAETNLVAGDEESASKYLRILLNDPRQRKWALEHFPENWSPAYRMRVEHLRSLAPEIDFIHGMDQTRIILQVLLNANPRNSLALDYLLCYDLLMKDLDAFVADYAPSLTASVLYEEAMLIFLAAKGGMTDDNFAHYHISASTLERFKRFVTLYKRDNGAMRNLTADFGETYWYYFYFAQRNEKQ